MNQPNKGPGGPRPQTRHTFEEWCLSEVYDNPTNNALRKEAWNAVLDSVILPEGKGFNIGDRLVAYHPAHGDYSPKGVITVRLDNGSLLDSEDKGYDFRPLPQMVELTDDEKFLAIITKNPSWTARDALIAAQGKTLDQLCTEHGVATTREI